MTVATSRAASPTIPPTQPDGPWVMDGEKGECILQRNYKIDKSVLTMALISDPYDDDFTLILVGKDLPLGRASGHLALLPDGRDVNIHTVGDKLANGRRAETVMPEKADPPKLQRNLNTVTITIGRFRWSLATPKFDQALKALTECDRMLIQSWGLDPDERAHIATPVEMESDKAWLKSSDYPNRALLEGVQGNTRILFTVNIDGHVTDCRVVISSGNKQLDDTVCSHLIARGHFTPAQDAAGHPVAAHETSTIAWRVGL